MIANIAIDIGNICNRLEMSWLTELLLFRKEVTISLYRDMHELYDPCVIYICQIIIKIFEYHILAMNTGFDLFCYGKQSYKI